MDVNQTNNKCFVGTLGKLRESSKDAVVSADFSDEYTLYMHVDRPVQDAFVSILEETYNTEHSELILLCGSVGDGKSHMLSYCSNKYPEMMSRFYVHNDSTASLYVDKPASYTLMELMEDFTDEKIDSSNKKVILAINLGTLNNFLEEDKNNRFIRLREYVDKAGILDRRIGAESNDEFFHSVNFADYHLFELSETGVQSDYVLGLIKKITQQSEDNIFYSEYCTCCKNCEACQKCPIKVNYELLSDDNVQHGIINSLVEAIVKNKLIVSTRSLLNFLYEIIVDERHFDRGSLEPRKEPGKRNNVEYCQSLLPNTLFGRRGSSEMLDSMTTVDPMRIRNEAIDDFFVYYENSSDTLTIFETDLADYKDVVNRLHDIDFSDPSTHGIKEELLKIYVRLCWLTGRRKGLLPDDLDYKEYMSALFHWNNGEYKELKDVYSLVERGVLAWNGPAGKNEMQIPVANKKTEYHLVQELQIKAIPDSTEVVKKDKLVNFQDELKLKYKYNTETAELELDYALYALLKRVISGYIPSINDKRVNVKCVEFIKKISRGGKKMESLIIRDQTHKEAKEYHLEFNDTFGFTFEEI